MINNIIHNLELVADSSQSEPMSQYMLNQFKFLGIRAEIRRATTKDFIKLSKALAVEEVILTVEELWLLPFREYQYVAVDILLANYKRFSLQDIARIISLITIKSWWDSVDGLISCIDKVMLKNILQQHEIISIIEKYRYSNNIWLVRMAILHQLGWKNQTNVELLFSLALQHASSKEFFIRKAIGWALRDYAKSSPDEVYNFIDLHKEKFSGLTYREAAKHRKATED